MTVIRLTLQFRQWVGLTSPGPAILRPDRRVSSAGSEKQFVIWMHHLPARGKKCECIDGVPRIIASILFPLSVSSLTYITASRKGGIIIQKKLNNYMNNFLNILANRKQRLKISWWIFRISKRIAKSTHTHQKKGRLIIYISLKCLKRVKLP